MGVSRGGDELMLWDGDGSGGGGGAGGGRGGGGERILVSVRLRPINGKEIAANDFADWECINDTTIIFKNCLGERSMYPNAYAFGKSFLSMQSDNLIVFGFNCSTKQVYEEAAKEVILSVVDGINATIFAYGQTSSGKTFTMGGITQYSVADIYDHIDRHNEREFVLKFSALEIYNEAVRDLLSSDSTPLRLLDDPERGTVVDKLIEERLRDKSHLMELLAVCEAQRQVGETTLNETSSRSHQIIRLTVESSAKQLLGAANSSTLAASVNFVDLAGSERASQTLSAGTRLKEGCHINRSLLTLGKVIRNLSKGRHGHIPYRDSKLTRILQSSLGGNSRTAIICTMSPAHSHLEQSRNTLLFATCAKEVTTNAQVNVVMSDKALVKQLRKELSRLEGELKNMSAVSASGDYAALLRDKEQQIEKMDKEIKELSQQRDIALSQVEELLRSSGQQEVSILQDAAHQFLPHRRKISWLDSSSVTTDASDYQRIDADLRTFQSNGQDDLELIGSQPELLESFENNILSDGPSPQPLRNPMELGASNPETYQGSEDIVEKTCRDADDDCKEVRCIEVEDSRQNRNAQDDNSTKEHEQGFQENEDQTLAELDDRYNILSPKKMKMEPCDIPLDSEALVKRIRELQKTIDDLVHCNPGEYSPYSSESNSSSCRGFNLRRSRSCKAIFTGTTPLQRFEKLGKDIYMISNGVEGINERPRILHASGDLKGVEVVEGYKELRAPNEAALANETEHEKNILDASNITNIHSLVTASSDVSITSAGNQEDEEYSMVEAKATVPTSNQSSDSEKENATDEMRTDHLSLSHSQEQNETQDNSGMTPEDGALVAIEVGKQTPTSWPQEFERQRKMIIELWNACHTSLVHRTFFFLLFKGDPSDSIYLEVELRRLSFIKSKFSQGARIVMDGQLLTPATCARNLVREREMLIKQMQKKFTEKEREGLFQKWGIALDSKRRRLQLANRLWTDTEDTDHARESAALTAKLVGFTDEDELQKEMFVGPSFTARAISRRSYSWKI
ncbi:hypothetical protein Droror1_Dr00007211 [Drosera rotundifolia]